MNLAPITALFTARGINVGIGVDGTCMLLCEEGYREAMTGTLSLYDGQGGRLHTIYLGAIPGYGKARCFERMEREIGHIIAVVEW